MIDEQVVCDYCSLDDARLGLLIVPEFRGTHRFLSNFWPAAVEFEGVLYPSVEHAYQAAKTNDLEWRKSIQNCPSASAAKQLGKMVKIRENWNKLRNGIMLDLLRRKFQDPPLRDMLLATGNDQLIEGNWWGDVYWGVCKGKGENHLGRLLMQVRLEVRQQ